MPTDPSQYRLPAEFEENHHSIWFAWPKFEPIRNGSLVPYVLAAAKAVAPFVNVNLIVDDAESEVEVKPIVEAALGEHLARKVCYRHVPHDDVWIRDMGCIYTRDAKDRLACVHFKFNSWGAGSISPVFEESGKAGEQMGPIIADMLGIPILHSTLCLEGGGIEANGQGTVIVTESVVLQPQRNPGWTKAQAEAELKRVLNVQKVIWLAKGTVSDDQAIYGPINDAWGIGPMGHTDEFVRFVGDNVVLLAEVTEEEARTSGESSVPAENRRRFENACNRLKNETTALGNKLQVIRLPMPEDSTYVAYPGDGMYDMLALMTRVDPGHEGKPVLDTNHPYAKVMAASSYLNYLVTNKVILAPKFAKPDDLPDSSPAKKDAQAKKVLEEAFPGRKVVQFDVTLPNYSGGGIHCFTQQMPQGQTDWYKKASE